MTSIRVRKEDDTSLMWRFLNAHKYPHEEGEDDLYGAIIFRLETPLPTGGRVIVGYIWAIEELYETRRLHICIRKEFHGLWATHELWDECLLVFRFYGVRQLIAYDYTDDRRHHRICNFLVRRAGFSWEGGSAWLDLDKEDQAWAEKPQR